MVFDKDDPFAMDFVTAATSIRAFNFSIEMESLFKIKEMAGKIVPAISSSNALVAALQVHEAIKLLSGDERDKDLRGISYMRLGGNTRLSSLKRVNEPPKSDCKVCQDDSSFIAQASVKSFEQAKLKDFVDSILPHCLSVKGESMLVEFNGKIIYEREPDLSEDESQLYEKRLAKTFNELNLKNYSIVYVQGVLDGQEDDSNFYIQLHEDKTLTENWKASYIKKGVKKPLISDTQEEKKTAPVNGGSTTLEIEDDQEGLIC